jgi:hypothetical protein
VLHITHLLSSAADAVAHRHLLSLDLRCRKYQVSHHGKVNPKCTNPIFFRVKQPLLDAHAKVQVNLTTKKVLVESSEDRATVAAVLAEAGYPAA